MKKIKKKLTPSQLRIKRLKRKITPSQKPIRRKKKKPSPPSQPSTRRKKIKIKPPRRRPSPRKQPPSQPPVRRPPTRRFPPPKPPARPPRLPPPTKEPPIVPLKKAKKFKPKRKKKKKQAFNVFARPLKKKGAKKRPKLIKVTKKPLTKRRAEDVKSFVLDRSLARTGRIKPVKGKPGTAPRRVPRGFAKKTRFKFRGFRIIKGKRVPLPKGTSIERKKFVGDTRSEQRGLTLRKQITQINKPKRKVSQKVLQNLARGRKIRLANLKKMITLNNINSIENNNG